MKFTFLPTPDTWDKAIATMKDAGHEYVDSLDDAEALFYWGAPADFPELPESLGFVQFHLAGIDGYRLAGKLDPKVRFANAAGVYADPVAESTIAMILAVMHKYPQIVRAESWGVQNYLLDHTQWLHGQQTLTVLGAGGIGKRLLEFLSGFPLHTIAVNNSGREVEQADETFKIDQLDEVLPRTDILVLLAPLTEETYHIIDLEALKKLPNSAIVVNVGRGPLIHTPDLVTALETGEIRGAALDVTEPEPLPDGHVLWQMDNVLITPHVANTTSRIRALIGDTFAANAKAFAAGEKMPTEVDVKRGY